MEEENGSSPPPSKKLCMEDNVIKRQAEESQGDTEKEDMKEAIDLPKKVDASFTRIKRRKFAVLLSYNGKDYKGMQWNPGFPSIEQDLLDAMCKAVAFPADMAGDLNKLKFQRCARTDKGVSAARQVVSLKMAELDDARSQINAHLPPHIRVFAVKRVTKSFDARHACSGRMYEYLLPTYTLAPYHLTRRDYRVSDETVAYLERLLKRYEGTHNYHNFTSGKKYEDMSSKRYITSFRCGLKFVAGDASKPDQVPLEFIPLRVKGQSFVLHQIRKMIGFVIAIIRGYLKESDFDDAFLKEKVDIPRAPALGLLLEDVYFDFYNAKFANSGERERLEWEELDDVVGKFKKEHIHRTIVETELKEMPTMQWLHTLQIHDFHGTAQRIKDAETAKSTSQETSGVVSKDVGNMEMEDKYSSCTEAILTKEEGTHLIQCCETSDKCKVNKEGSQGENSESSTLQDCKEESDKKVDIRSLDSHCKSVPVKVTDEIDRR